MDIGKLEEKKEYLASKVHDAWWEEKAKQGFHSPNDGHNKDNVLSFSLAIALKFDRRCEKCHADMYPYNELPWNVKEYNRVMVQTVLDAIESF